MQVEEIPDYGDDRLTVYSKTTFATIPLVLEVYLVIALRKHPASGKSASKKKPRRSWYVLYNYIIYKLYVYMFIQTVL